MSISKFVPAAGWLRTYDKATGKSDLVAGVTVAVMLVPQAMAYALLAGLPPVVGLYAAVAPLLLYGLLGTSGQLAVGPVAMVSLLVAAGVGAIAEPGSGEYIALALALALMVGVMQLAMGVFRLGFLVNFLSHPVVSGFTSAAALIIGTSQLKHILGVGLARDHRVHYVLAEAARRADEIKWPTLAFGVGAIAILLAVKRMKRSIPGALVVVVVGTVAAALIGVDKLGVRIVGEVPAGLPPLTVPGFEWSTLALLFPTAAAISLVGFMESISVAKYFAARTGQKLDANQELVALGMANLGAAFTGAFPVTGGFSRTAVNADAGAKTGLASVVTGGLILLTLAFLTGLFHWLPVPVLAAIIVVAVAGLVDVAAMKHLWAVDRVDFALMATTFLATLTLGIEAGIGVGVGASVLSFVARRSRPFYAVLGRLPGTTVYRNVDNHPEARTTDGVLAVRFDAAFYFGNVTFLKDRLEYEEQRLQGPLKAVVLDASGVNALDSSGLEALEAIADSYRERGVEFRLAEVKGPVRESLARAHLAERLTAVHLTVHEAMEATFSGVDEVSPPQPPGAMTACG